MSDEQIIEYLRSRGRGVPPADLTGAVMAAVESAPASRSWFAPLVPAAAAVAAAAALLVLALLIEQPPGVGPAPSGSEEPTPAPSITPSASPEPSTPALSLVQPGQVVEIVAVDDAGEWGTVRVERGPDLGGYPDAAIDPGLFVIELVVTYAPERVPDPPQFGASDWTLRPSDPNAEHFFVVEPSVFERADGFGSRPEPALGIYPGAVDIFTTPTEGTIAFSVPRREANLALELVYRSASGEEVVMAVRTPGPPPEPVAVTTPSASAAQNAAEAAAAAARAEELLLTPDECTNPVAGYTVTFPDAWYTNTETGDVAACSWFTPDFFEVRAAGVAPDEIWISIGVFDGVVGYTSLTPVYSGDDVTIDGRQGHRAEFNPDWDAKPDYRAYHYVIPLSESGPTLVASTNNERADDYALAKAVLDRIMASFAFVD